MKQNNNFFIKNLKSVIFFGESKNLKDFIEINKKLDIQSIIITTSHQSKLISNDLKFTVYNKLDDKLKNFISSKLNPKETLFISLGARYIFDNENIQKFFHNNLVNFHFTRLPLDAGSGGFSWQIMREDRIHNQLVHLIDSSIDTGPIISHQKSLFPKHCQIPQDYEEYKIKKSKVFYSDFISKVIKGHEFPLIYQTNYLGSYNPRLNTLKNGFIDWSIQSNDIFNFINAFDDPYEGASTYINRGDFGKLHIKKVHLHGGESSNHPYMSGLVLRHDKDWIVVATNGKYCLLIEEVLLKNRNILSEIRVGDRFFTPKVKIDDSMSKRIFYDSKGLK